MASPGGAVNSSPLWPSDYPESEVALQNAAIRTRMSHVDADSLQDSLYIVGFPNLVVSPQTTDNPYVHKHCITKARQQSANRIFHHHNGHPEIHRDFLRHRLGAPSPALCSQSVESAVNHGILPPLCLLLQLMPAIAMPSTSPRPPTVPPGSNCRMSPQRAKSSAFLPAVSTPMAPTF